MTESSLGAGGKSRALRVFALTFALLQIVLQGTFAVGDGYEQLQQARSHIAPVHAEVPGNTHHRLHTDDCVICHVLASGAELPPPAIQSWHGESNSVAIPSSARHARPYAVVAGARLARAPPVTV